METFVILEAFDRSHQDLWKGNLPLIPDRFALKFGGVKYIVASVYVELRRSGTAFQHITVVDPENPPVDQVGLSNFFKPRASSGETGDYGTGSGQ